MELTRIIIAIVIAVLMAILVNFLIGKFLPAISSVAWIFVIVTFIVVFFSSKRELDLRWR